MATKFYLLHEPAPYTPPTWEGGWDAVSALAVGTRAFDPHKFGAHITGTFTAVMSETVTTSPYRMGVIRLVSRRLKRNKTIAGTVDMVVGLLQSSADADYFTRLHLYIIDTSDDSIVGTLLNGYEESSGGGGTEWPFPAVGRALQSPQALSSVLVPDDAGDYRLVAELGVRAENTHTTARIAGVRYGARTGEPTFAPLNDLTVGASSSALAGFLEFSDDIELADDVVPNVTIETAIELTAGVPITQDMRDGGYTYEGWYKRTAAEVFSSVWAFGDLTTYKPLIQGYRAVGVVHLLTGEGGAVNEIHNDRRNKPVEVVTVPGTTYYFRVSPNTGNPTPASLTIVVEIPPDSVAPSGALLVIDDTFEYPAALLSATTGEVLRFVTPFASSEAGAILPNGISCFVDDDEVTTGVATVKVYDAALNLIASLPLDVRGQGPVSSNNLDRFYVSNVYNGGVYQGSIHLVTSGGVHLGKVAHVTGTPSLRSLLGIAVSPDESILYYSYYHIANGFEVGKIYRWNLTTDSAESDLAAAVSNYHICREILVLPDGTILASYNHFNDVGSFVRHYSEAGAVLHTYDLEPEVRISDEIRLAHDPDGTSFWVWTKTGSDTALSKFRHIRVADGVDLLDPPIEVPYFNTGVYGPPETETPEMFGHSFSCPFVVLRSAVEGGGESRTPIIGPYVWVHCKFRIPAPADIPESTT